MKQVDFDNWWAIAENQSNAEMIFARQAEAICSRVDPNAETPNLYTDVLEKLARKHGLHEPQKAVFVYSEGQHRTMRHNGLLKLATVKGKEYTEVFTQEGGVSNWDDAVVVHVEEDLPIDYFFYIIHRLKTASIIGIVRPNVYDKTSIASINRF